MGGNLELVRDGENGWLTPAGDAAALAARLLAIAQTPEPLFAMRAAARASVADRTLASYADFALETYAALNLPTPQTLPSIVAVACDDFGAVDVPALRRASRAGAWDDAEWLPAEALSGAAECGAVRAVVGLNGRVAGAAVRALEADVPGVAVGAAGRRALSGARDLRYVPDLSALALGAAGRARTLEDA